MRSGSLIRTVCFSAQVLSLLGMVKLTGVGNWVSHVPIPSSMSLDQFSETLEEDDERLFLAFLRKMLTWDPKDRASAIDLLSDPWLLIK